MAETLLSRVLYWTGGHPYLTQRLCQAITEHLISDPRQPTTGNRHPVSLVDRLCAELFLTRSARESDDNLAFVRSRLLQSEGDLVGVLELYRRIWSGHPVADDETNSLTSLLKLSGAVRAEEGRLVIRNRIYRTMFDRAWVQAHMPDAELRRQRAAYRKGLVRAAAVGTASVLVVGSLAFVAISNARTARIALENAVADRNRARQEKERADAALVALKIEHDHANAETERADREARMAREMAKAFAAQQPKRLAAVAPPIAANATGASADATGVNRQPKPVATAWPVSKATASKLGISQPKHLSTPAELKLRFTDHPQKSDIGSGIARTTPGKKPGFFNVDPPISAAEQAIDIAFRPFWLFLLPPANAEMSTRNGITQIDINVIDRSDWHVEAVLPIDSLEEGAIYRFRFRARADTPRDVEINFQIDSGDYHTVVSPRPHAYLNTTWRTFQFDVRPSAVGERNQIAFFLGNRLGTVWMTDVSIRKEFRKEELRKESR